MKKLLFFISVFGLLLSSITSASETKNRGSSGIIIFHGAIVEGPCMMDFQTNDISSRCYRSGMKKEQLNTKTITKKTTSLANLIPANVGHAKLQWIDDSKSLAMVVVSYL
ncbi:type 1 fimbrial protein [Morganella psychrotolerans]|uniref:Type 1 fimbrial protein n=1 Tax=Morganella psychrotolerans TaxID=368603 RepID=A0A5M9RBT9_9GAMM|nr:hypothetical protein [Morganella psychrotolerans]KAA8717707.1 type 1 fimbrial protein [Morganella psychrotolerans]OBU08048.1 hypothetical protein AYY16_01345 [Morganella psychrotolerans]